MVGSGAAAALPLFSFAHERRRPADFVAAFFKGRAFVQAQTSEFRVSIFNFLGLPRFKTPFARRIMFPFNSRRINTCKRITKQTTLTGIIYLTSLGIPVSLSLCMASAQFRQDGA